jgi:hypothetical protein
LRTGSGLSASIRLLLLWFCSAVFLASSPKQPGVDFFRAQVCENRFNQRSSRKDETVSDQNRVDGEVCGFIPKLWITLAPATLVAQCTMQDFVGECSLEFRRFELIHEGRVVDNARAVSRHRWQSSRYQFQPQAERAKERLLQDKLNAAAG